MKQKQLKEAKMAKYPYYQSSGYGGFEWDDSPSSYGKSKAKSSYRRCHEDHKELEIGGGILLGASCNSPRSGYDIYVGFDWGMHLPAPPSPWNPGDEGEDPHAIHAKFQITDGSVPSDTDEAKRMVTWLVGQLAEGRRIHIGCIGGHGRTGMIMAAIVKEALGEKDAIAWVRKHHCKKAVETQTQVDWLQKHYGIKPAKPSRGSWGADSFAGKYSGKYGGNGYLSGGKSKGKGGTVTAIKSGPDAPDFNAAREGTKYHPIESPTRIFSGAGD